MLAYKVLRDGRSPFTGRPWPLPTADEPGGWVCAIGDLSLCTNGVHACTVRQLPQWLGEELWVIELEGDILDADPALVAARGRLVSPVERWNGRTRRQFAEACAARARQVTDEPSGGHVLLETIQHLAALGLAAAAGYWTAVLAGEHVAGQRAGPVYDEVFARERSAQADWLEHELGLGVIRACREGR